MSNNITLNFNQQKIIDNINISLRSNNKCIVKINPGHGKNRILFHKIINQAQAQT